MVASSIYLTLSPEVSDVRQCSVSCTIRVIRDEDSGSDIQENGPFVEPLGSIYRPERFSVLLLPQLLPTTRSLPATEYLTRVLSFPRPRLTSFAALPCEPLHFRASPKKAPATRV